MGQNNRFYLPVFFYIFFICFDACSPVMQEKMSTHTHLSYDHFGETGDDVSLYTRHYTHHRDEIKGIALIIHGLNLAPRKMETLIHFLNTNRIDVISLSLRGHGSNFESLTGLNEKTARIRAFKNVSYNLWLKETREAYRVAQKLSLSKNVPLFFVGFSLGGLLGTDLISSDKQYRFDKMVLFAPALNIHPVHYSVKIFYPFSGLVIPSLCPEEYRSNWGTTIAAYHSLFDAVEHFNQNINSGLNIPTIVFIDKKDELVSFKGLRRIIKTGNLDQWKMYDIRKVKSETDVKYHHLLIDEHSVGKTTWKQMEQKIINHFF